MENSHCLIPEFQVVPETEVENLVVQDSERILRESSKPRLNFNPSFTEGVTPDRLGTEISVPKGPLILGGGTTSGCPSNTFVQDFSPPFSKINAFVNQEPRATAAATAATTTHQTTETTLKMGQKTLLKRSAVPFNVNNESRNVLFLFCQATRRSTVKK